MIRSYIKIALRNIRRHKFYSIINILGLAFGLTVGMLILLYVTDEFSFDDFHNNGDRIYKVVTTSEGGGMETNAWPVAAKLKSEYPEVEEVVYTRRAASNMLLNHEGERQALELFYGSEAFFDIFSFKFIEGSAANALVLPYSIVISEDFRDKYLNDGSVLGQTIMIQDTLEFTISGVIENIPDQSHIQFEALASFTTYQSLNKDFSYTEGWGNFNVRNYILLTQGSSIGSLAEKTKDIYMASEAGEWFDEMGMKLGISFIPLKDIYLNDTYYNGFGPNASLNQVILVAAIALFVLLQACINYINLSTARAVYRAKEVGLRKIVGSSRRAIFWQFQAEVFLLTLASFTLVALLIDIILPFFNDLMEKTYSISSLLSPAVMLGTLVMIIGITFLAGYYPSTILSAYQPADILKSSMGAKSTSGINLRRILVMVQFAVSGILVMATFVVLSQLNYMRNQNLGFAREQIVVMDLTNVPETSSAATLKKILSEYVDIGAITLTNALPGKPGWQGQWAYPEGAPEGAEHISTEYLAVDEFYLETLDLQLIAGVNFDTYNQTHLDEGLIINETTVREMGWVTPQNAIGKRITSPSGHPAGLVIGVVKDYHGMSLQSEIWPKAMDYNPGYGRYLALRFTTGNTSELVETLEKSWKTAVGDYSYEYFFLDQEFDKQYRSEERLMRVFVIFAILTVVIASIGLLGLVSFIVVSRTREIGIRKILGADTSRLVSLLSREFILLVFAAHVLILPVVWIGGKQWLATYAYHMEMNMNILLLSMGLMLLLTLLIVGAQTLHAAQRNPVDTLRNE